MQIQKSFKFYLSFIHPLILFSTSFNIDDSGRDCCAIHVQQSLFFIFKAKNQNTTIDLHTYRGYIRRVTMNHREAIMWLIRKKQR